MKKHTILLAVVLLTAGTLATGCSNDDAAVGNPIQQTAATGEMAFSATIAPKSNSTRSVNESGVTTWVVDEKIAVYYEKDGGGYDKATANVDDVVNGVATITASLRAAKNGGEVKFVYPASIVDVQGDDINIDRLRNYQHGTIADISANFDAATATATLSTDGTTCGTTATVKFTNQVLIGKFTPKLNGTPIDGITALTIILGTRDYDDDYYFVVPSSGTFGTDGIYVAMLPVTAKRVKVMVKTSSQTYVFCKSVTLEVSKLYNNLAIECYPQDIDLSSLTDDITLMDGQVLTGTLSGNHKISIADGATITLLNATINVSDGPGIKCKGDATIYMPYGGNDNTNRVATSASDMPAIFVPEDKTLTIDSDNDNYTLLTAVGGNFGAGIGSGRSEGIYCCGNIVITGGHITAVGGCAAGIGSGEGECGNITITGGHIEAKGGADAAGIGSGAGGRCGDITITGGNVKAIGANSGMGIGCGSGGRCGDIYIGGRASGSAESYNDYDISTGNYDECGTVNVVPGTISGIIDPATTIPSVTFNVCYHLSYDSSTGEGTDIPDIGTASSITINYGTETKTITGTFTDGSTVKTVLPLMENQTLTLTSTISYNNGASSTTCSCTIQDVTLSKGDVRDFGDVHLVSQ